MQNQYIQNAAFLTVKADGSYSYRSALRVNQTQSAASLYTFSRNVLISPSHLRLGRLNGLFPSGSFK
jgi:hypothetical protein